MAHKARNTARQHAMHQPLKTLPSRWLSLAVLAASSLIAPAQAQGLLQAMQGQRAQPVIGATADTAHVHAELLADAPAGIKAGTTFELGLWLDHKAGWHSYWKNPGDTGLPTELKWDLPAGLSAGDIAWPAPEKKTIGSLANYGYEGQILLTVPVTRAVTSAGSCLSRADRRSHPIQILLNQHGEAP